ncbi:MAG: hypothetical protein ABW004_16650 [Aeromicrobium sp.]
MSAPSTTQTWWRRERLAIVLLPIIVVAVVVLTGSRVNEYWWQRGFHEEAPRDAQGVASIEDEYDDGYLTYPIRADISLVSAEPVTELPGAYRPAKVPTGARLWEVRLRWRADPDVSLTGCAIALVDDDGNRYEVNATSFDAGAPTAVETCVPDETPGPKPRLGSTDAPAVGPGEQPRPESYETRAYIVTPDDAEPTAVRVWWFLPVYAELPLS